MTGATGFLGRVTVGRLRAEGHSVVAQAHIRPARFDADVEVRLGDLLDRASLAKITADVDAIVHLAGEAHNRESSTDPLRAFRINGCGTVNLLESLPANGACRSVVFASTSLVYGYGRAGPLTEDAGTEPPSSYAASKLFAEQAIGAFVRAGRIGATVLRACNIAGAVDGIRDEDRSRVVPLLMAAASGQASGARLQADPEVVREYLHVDDFVRAVLLALDHSAVGDFRVYNVGTGRPLTLDELCGFAHEITGHQIPLVHRRGIPGTGTVVLDSTRIGRELGWQPRRGDPRTILADAWRAEQRDGG